MSQDSFRASVKADFPLFRFAIHNLLLMDALTLVERGLIRFLCIEMPPRHSKTEICSIQFPKWVLKRHPNWRVVLASYSQQLSVLNSRRIRDYLQNTGKIREDKASEREWEMIAGGGVRAVGIGSGLTGFGADLMIIDDPVKDAEEARSMTTLDNHWDWYTTVARTRLQPGGRIVMPMTRWALNDLAGRVQRESKTNSDADQWYVLRLPALALDDDPLGRPLGAALWPDAYPEKDLMAIRALDVNNFESLYQQNPQGAIGKKFNRDDIKIAPIPIEKMQICRSWDLAITDDETSDYLAGALVGGRLVPLDDETKKILVAARMELPYQIHVGDLVRNRAEWPEQRQLIIETALKDGPGVPVIIEATRLDLAAAQQVKRDLEALGCVVRRIKPKGDKIARKGRLQVIARQGHLSFEPADWNETALREFDEFPGAAHDDIVDCIEQGCTYLTKPDWEMSVI